MPKVVEEVTTEALFRHKVVTSVLALVILGYERSIAIDKTTQSVHVTETGQVRVLSTRTLYRWLAEYQKGGIAALEPAKRVLVSKALSDELIAFLKDEKAHDPDASIPELLRRAEQRNVISSDDKVHRATVWRALKRLEVPTSSRSAKQHADIRRFAYPHRMRMVLVDGKHFRAGVGRLKRVAFFFIDDCSRRVLWAVVGPSESSALLLRGLYEVVRHFGLMDILYFDRGPGFIANDTHSVCTRVHIHFIHGKARYPQGHGKVEAFNKTAHHDILRAMARAEVDPDFGSLELRLRHYIEYQYNVRPHESLDGQTPEQRWQSDERELTFPRDHDDLRSRFVLTESRRVSGDNIVSVNRTRYEVPIGHRLKWIAVQRHLLDNSVKIVHEGKLVQLHPVDLAHNAEAKRARQTTTKDESREAPKTAATMAYERCFGPVDPATSQSTKGRKVKKGKS